MANSVIRGIRSIKDASVESEQAASVGNYFLDEGIREMLKINPTTDFGKYKDPTITGFKVFFHFAEKSGLLASEQFTNSALAYFERLGDNARYAATKRFHSILSSISTEGRWMFKSLDGLDTLWNRPRTNLYEPYTINISMYEAIDFRVVALNKLYRDITWDQNRQVYVLPRNLRSFGMSVYIYDARFFGAYDLNGSYHDFLQNPDNKNVVDINHVMFDLGECEFTTESGSDFFTGLDNTSLSEPSGGNLSIGGRTFKESALFKTLTGTQSLSPVLFNLLQSAATDKITGLEPRQSTTNKIKSALESSQVYERAKGIATTAITREVSKYRQNLLSKLGGLLLGNLTGVSPSDLIQAAKTGNYEQTDNLNSQIVKHPPLPSDASLIDKNFMNG